MILDKIAAAAKIRVAKAKLANPLPLLQSVLQSENKFKRDCVPFPFEAALSKPGLNFICEVKKASPSKGLISVDFKYKEIAKEYENCGAAAISVLTEPDFFMGKNEYLTQIKQTVKIPVLRKDFIIDEYQIYEAKYIGADAILLITAILDLETLKRFYALARSLGLSCLVEVHDEKELETALKTDAKIIGVNNRNLKDFTEDINNSLNLRKLVANDKIFVSESAIKTKEHIDLLRQNNVNAVLIGETLMKSGNMRKKLEELKSGL
ncbi:MAG: indole-3-glycerol phosphate synthase TrpC [Endomicrobium sp.]|jgi:indole-3-glycerol phosphate synthase|nr:indole-3-glycerol phosphate synthase TrpC [Endomicrobium sp.]